MLPRLARARAWIAGLAVIVALAVIARARPTSEAPILLAMAALATLLPRRPRWRLPICGQLSRHREVVTCTVLAAIGLVSFGPIVQIGDAGRHADWSQNLAVVDEIVREWSAGRPTPAVFLGVAAGDPTRDLYATLVHQLAAAITLALGDPARSHAVTMTLVLLAWIGAAVGVTRLALRFSAWPIALLAGLACLFDSTTMFTWGVAATWYWGLFPSTCAIALIVNGLPALVDLLETPATKARIASVWIFLGLGAITHPIGLLFDVVVLLAAIVCMAFACTPYRKRWASATLHVALALGLSAFAWLPATSRLTTYAAHFGNPQIPVPLALERSISGLLPETSFATMMAVSVFTLLAGRRAATFLWLAAWVMLSLYLEPLFLDLGLAPTLTSARLQCFRTTSVAMPLLYAASGALLSAPASVPHGRYGRLTRLVPAIASVVALGWLGTAPFESAASWARGHAHAQLDLVGQPRLTNRVALGEMLAWFRDQASTITPGSYARVAYEWGGDPINEVLRVHAESGVPITTHGNFVPVFVARDQLHDVTPENLRRWAIRWSIGADQVQPVGDPGTERRFGMLRVQEVPTWDGQLVHVVRGDGTARLAEIDDAHLAIDVEAAAPVLVEIGVPYFPRWRGEHAGHAITPCAQPTRARDPTEQRVLAAWMPPGRTVLRPNGSLPSDPIGWPVTAVALALAYTAWPRREGDRIDARLTRGRATFVRVIERWSGSFLACVALVLAFAIPARQGAFGGTARALRFGGAFPSADIDVITVDGPRRCSARDALGHDIRCPGGVRALLVVTHNVTDASVGWPVPLPGVLVNAGGPFDLVVHAAGTWSPGEHRVFCGGACTRVRVVVDGRELSFGPLETRTFTIDAPQEGLDVHVEGGRGETPITLVRSDAIDVDRHADVPFCGEHP